MKINGKVLVILLISVILLITGCAGDKTAKSYSIDREITGKLVAMDKRDSFTDLYFDGDAPSIKVSNASIECWRIRNGFINDWTYKLSAIGITYNRYHIVGIDQSVLTEEQYKELK